MAVGMRAQRRGDMGLSSLFFQVVVLKISFWKLANLMFGERFYVQKLCAQRIGRVDYRRCMIFS